MGGQNWLRHHRKDFIKYYPFGGVAEWEVIELQGKEESRIKEEKYYLGKNRSRALKQKKICREKKLAPQCQQVIYY